MVSTISILVQISCLLLYSHIGRADDVIVTTKNGQLLGSRYNITSDWSIDTFLGIPYGAPPTGLGRWNKSTPAAPWSGIRSAKTFGNVCLQGANPAWSPNEYNVTQSEDCLNLNIYGPRKSSDPALVPVMVYIHGGAFVNGAGLVVNGTQLSMKGVTVVTLNYRLGALGFLSTEDQAAPGNFGLLDQLLALQWVQDNIQAFGGDPGRVTVFGDSAGSASVSLLLTSPLSKGLFHAAICESGVGLANWAVAMKTDVLRPRDRARLLGIGLGCIKATTQEVVDCLRTKDAEDINKAVVKIALDRLMWSPVVDTFYQTVPDLPINSWKNGKVMDVPIIRGTNSGEWAAYIAKIQGNHSGIKASFFLEQIHEYVHQRFFKNRKVIEDDIKMVYATPYNLSTPELVRDSFLQLVSDDLFTAPIVLETQLDAKLGGNGKTYFYVFSYVSKNTLPKWEGAPHGYEKAFVFGEPFNKVLDYSNYTDIDCFFSLTMMELWTNFAKYGDPTPQPLYGARWEPFTSVYNQSYFLLDSSTPKSHQNFRYEATKLWNVVIPALKKTI